MVRRVGFWIWTWLSEPTNLEQARTAIDQVMEKGTPQDQVGVLSEILARIDSGELTGDANEVASLRDYAASKLDQAKSAMERQQNQPNVLQSLTPPSTDTQSELDEIDLLEQAWNDDVTQWAKNWHDTIDKLFAFKGTLGFGYGGPPVTTINHARVSMKEHEFRTQANGIIEKLRNSIRPSWWGQHYAQYYSPPDKQQFEANLARAKQDYAALKQRMDDELTGWVKTYQKYFPMTNFINFIQQYIVGRVLGGIGNVSRTIVYKIAQKFAPKLAFDVDQKAEELRRGAERLAKQPGGKWGAEQMARQAKYYSRWTVSHVLQHGLPKEGAFPPPKVPPLGPLPSGPISIPESGTLSIPESKLTDISNALAGIVGFKALVDLVTTKVEGKLSQVIDDIAPGDLAKLARDVVDRQMAGETVDLDEEAAKWINNHREAIEVEVEKAAEQAWEEAMQELGDTLPQSMERAASMQRRAWRQQMNTFYKSAAALTNYTEVGAILDELKRLNLQAPTDQDRQWGEGLVAAVELYYNELKDAWEKQFAVKRSENAFTVPVKVGGNK